MALLGPQGFKELGELIIMQSHFAARRLAEIMGVGVPFKNGFFKEFVVDFSKTGRTVAEINAQLRQRGIFGGKDLSKEIPALGQSALYCVTEVHSTEDIERLASAIEQVVA